MLVGRSAECELLRRLIAGAREESAGVILLRGEPGIGKTSLLTFTADAADGFRVLQIQGHESEIEIPFAGLSWLLESLTGLLGQLPPVQAEALAGALQLGPAAGSGGERLAVATATLTLLAAAADAQPLLVAVDDGQWLDVPSLEAIVFAARRLQAEAIAVVITARPAVDVPAEVNRLLEALPEHTVPRLAPDAARELLAAQQAGLAPEVLAGRIAEAAGNPLALLELPAPGDGGLPVEPLRIGKRLEQAFGRRIATMPPPTRQAMLLVAAADAASDVLSQALAQDGLSPADLEPAETAGLLVSERGAVRFQHPLVRSALYQSATATQRRAAHRVLASVFGALSTPRAQERHAWHLAAAAVGPDEEVAAALDAAADAAAARRSYATAMDVQERAAWLSWPGDDRAGRLMKAATMSFPAGRVQAGLPLLDQVLEETGNWRLRTEAQHCRCRILMWAGQPVAGRDLLIAEANQVEPRDPAWSAIMRAHAALTSATLGDQRLAAAEGQRAVELLAGLPDSLTMPALVVRALTLAVSGPVAEARSLLARSEEPLQVWDPLDIDQILLAAAVAWSLLEEPGESMRWFERAVGAAREASAVGLLPFQLSWLALAQWRGGKWPAAYANAHDGLALAEETGWRTQLPHSLAALATIEAAMGRAESCREHAAQAVALGRQTGVAIIEAHAAIALALLELGTGDAVAAVRHLEFVAGFAADHELGDPVLLNWAGDLAEALDRSGDRERARTVGELVAAEAERTGRPTESAVAARCRALLAGDDEAAEEAFAEAFGWHARADQPFQEARTRLQHGELLRRRRRRADARAELTAALALFEQLGAEPWAARARSELRATGVTARPRHPGQQQLTPQELRVALVVADGATNAEAAARLFLSAKTVEYHLSGAYRKLGIRSRGKLVRALANAPEPGSVTAAPRPGS
ncbi:MAG: AAA family ATPase [Streptosporangiaceae bacterium]|jgi:DNA-binding CsgD family transcriptional regulator